MKFTRALEASLLLAMIACKGKPVTSPDGSVNLDAINKSDCAWEAERHELERYISLGDAACAKKVIEQYKINLNIPMDGFAGKSTLPLAEALDSVLFAKSKGDMRQMVALLISLGADPNARNPKSSGGFFGGSSDGKGETMLEIALNLSSNYLSVKRYMIALPAVNVDLIGNKSYPVEIAMINQDVESAEALIERGANLKNHTYLPLLFQAIAKKFNSTALLLIQKGADKNESFLGNRPLDLSISHGLENVALELVNQNASIDYVPAGQGSLLHDAISAKMPNLTQRLIDKKLSPNLQDESGATPLHVAIQLEDPTSVNALLKVNANIEIANSKSETPLFFAVTRSQGEIAKSLVAKGAKIDVVDANGRSLIEAAPNADLALTMIAAGAPVDHKSKSGETPISTHVAAGRVAVVQTLKDRGANLNWTDKSGRTLLHVAASNNALDTAQYLIANGLSAQSADKNGNTPLFSAYSVDMLSLLVQNGADINQVNGESEMALSRWVPGADGSPQMLKEFLSRGALVTWRTKGRTYLMNTIAGYRPTGWYGNPDNAEGYVETIKTLIKAGVDHAALDPQTGLPAVQFLLLNPYTLRSGAGVEMLRAMIDGGVNPKQAARDDSTLGQELKDILAAQEKQYDKELKVAEQIGDKNEIEKVHAEYSGYIKNLRAAIELIR